MIEFKITFHEQIVSSFPVFPINYLFTSHSSLPDILPTDIILSAWLAVTANGEIIKQSIF
jgi:hypothetical protein